MKIIGLLTTILIVSIGVVFSVLNAHSVHVKYLIGEADLPMVVLLLITLIMGMLISFIIFGWSLLKLKSQNHRLKAQLKKLEEKDS